MSRYSKAWKDVTREETERKGLQEKTAVGRSQVEQREGVVVYHAFRSNTPIRNTHTANFVQREDDRQAKNEN